MKKWLRFFYVAAAFFAVFILARAIEISIAKRRVETPIKVETFERDLGMVLGHPMHTVTDLEKGVLCVVWNDQMRCMEDR